MTISKTYAKKPEVDGPTLKCPRCSRVHEYPQSEGAPIRCECGWWYRNVNGRIFEQFRSPF